MENKYFLVHYTVKRHDADVVRAKDEFEAAAVIEKRSTIGAIEVYKVTEIKREEAK